MLIMIIEVLCSISKCYIDLQDIHTRIVAEHVHNSCVSKGRNCASMIVVNCRIISQSEDALSGISG